MKETKHPEWALKHKRSGTELKVINGRYYLYDVKSVYDKTLKRSKKVSGGILGSITEEEGFKPSEKRLLKEKSNKSYLDKSIMSFEYGYAKWLLTTMEENGMLNDLKEHFPSLWQFIIGMIYCRTAYRSPLKNIPFYLSQSSIMELIDWKEKLSDQKLSDALFQLGKQTRAIHDFMKPTNHNGKTILMDATDIALQSNNISLAQKGYNANMDFQPQFVLLYLYDAQSLSPVYYRLLPGNIREISAMKNTIRMAGMEACTFIADKGFFSEGNITELEGLDMKYIIPLRRDNKQLDYSKLEKIEQTNNYFEHEGRFVFYAETQKQEHRNIDLFLDGKLKEQEKSDYLTRIRTVPESYSKDKFNEKVKSMGTLALMHNTNFASEKVYAEYKNRGAIEQLFDHLKNTIDASSSNMQREESLNGWMFINHLSMKIIYQLFMILKTTPMNKKQMLNHKYSINDSIQYLKSIQKIQFGKNEYVITEQNKTTKTLLEKMNISIT
ncbi:MAG: transposase [Chitinophagales bacterium]|nr:transposase [Chitinophagales bacterium]